MLRYYIYIWKRHVTEAISRTAKLLRDAPKGGSAYSRESKWLYLFDELEEFNYQYYEEYKRLYQTAYLLSIQLKQLA